MTRAQRISTVVAAVILVSPLWAGLADLAREAEWQRILEVAVRRGDQLPLSAEESMIVAHAARVTGDLEAEKLYLASSSVPETELGVLADVRLAELIGADDPDRALELLIPGLARGVSWPVRESATATAVQVISNGIDADRRAELDTAAQRLTRSLRRKIQLALAASDATDRREGLERLLASSTRDLTALRAAELLAEYESLTPIEEWRIASTWYRHALYERAAPLFEGLVEVGHSSIPRDEAAFLRGRCAFRHDRWSEAVSWYQRAISLARRVDRRADYEVHLGRTYELGNDLDEAVDAGVRAVRLKTTDDRRLFLARLRLRRGEPDLAAQGISRIRSRASKARGQVMLAIDELRRGEGASARSRLAKIRRKPWSGPAAVIAASLALGDGEEKTALQLLDRAVPSIEGFWLDQAGDVMRHVSDDELRAWRTVRQAAVAEATGRARWVALGRWAALEPDPVVLESLRQQIAGEFSDTWNLTIPTFPSGLAADLWRLGLDRDAARWDPSGFPRSNATESAWSAVRFLDFGFPDRSTRVADGAWRQAGSEVPVKALPTDLQKALHPLPNPALIRRAAAEGGVDWPLLAAVAREESRWDDRAVSAVGARGLVQLMPATAVSVARRIGSTEPTAADLFDPRVNLTLGASELARLLDVFDGRRAPAIAAYNAGERQAKLWLEQCGKGCTDAMYILNTSFGVTRVYTAQVLFAATRYAEIYGSEAVEQVAPG